MTQSGPSLRLIDKPVEVSTMINRILAILSIFFIFCFGDALACSCLSKGNFIDYASQSKGVIRARIVSYGDRLSHGETLFESMSVDVVSVVKGNLSFESIVLLGDPGHLCREYVDSRHFKIGKEFLIALHGDEAVQPFGGCGEAWLEIDSGVAKGRDWASGEPREYSLPLQDLLETLSQD